MPDNVAIVKELYTLFATRDHAGIRAIFAPAIEWQQMEGFPNGGVYHGADEIFAKVFDGFRDNWTAWRAVVKEYIDGGNDVFAIGYYDGVYKETGLSFKADFAHRYTLQDGLITKFTQYTDTYLVAKAMGR